MLGENILWAVVGFFIVLTPVVLVHELGHFIAARLSNIRVEEFGFGLPPRAVKLGVRNGTIFSLNWIPLGGFVRPAGEDDPTVPDGLAGASKRARFFVLIAGAGANFLLAFAIWWFAYVIGPPAVSISSVAPDSPAETAGLWPGDVILEVDGNTADNSNVIAEPMYQKGGQPVEMVVGRDGENVSLTVVPRRAGEYDPETEAPLGVGLSYTLLSIVEVAPNSPAAEVGLLPGDVIMEINGELVRNPDTIGDVLAAVESEPMAMTISRDGETIAVILNPPGPGEFDDKDIWGATYAVSQERIHRGLLEAMSTSMNSIGDYMALFVRVPVMLVRGEISPSEARPVSVVGISQMAGQMVEASAVSNNLFPLLNIMAFISIALGLTNLLPIPALDGGRIVFVLVEAVRGRRIEPEREGMVHVVGMLFLLGLMVLMIVQDIINPVIPLN